MLLSPHLDDAILSCGALIADARQCGVDVVVLTIFNGRPILPVSDAARRFHARCRLDDDRAMEEREREDERALCVVSARAVRLGLPEALYRKRSDGEARYETDLAIFEAGDQPGDETLAVVEERIAAQIAATNPDIVLAPLGIGGHIDHLLVSRAARHLARNALYYEDVPYVLYERCQGWQDSVAVGEAQLHLCTPRGWSSKIGAIRCYTSQQAILWYSPDTWQNDLTSYAQSIGHGGPAERLWVIHDQ